MGEQERLAVVRPHEVARHEMLGGMVRMLEQVGQGSAVEALAEHRGRLQGRLVGRVEPVDARLHQVLHRARDAGFRAVLGVPQQLLQEQRVAGGPLDAPRGELVRRVEERARQRQRLLAPQRAEVERDQRCAGDPVAPLPAERVALEPRGHHQERGAFRHRERQRGQLRQLQLAGPVDVLDHQHARPRPARPPHQPGHRAALALVARRVVHGVVEGAQVLRLRQVEQVVEEHGVVGRHPAVGHRPFGRCTEPPPLRS